MSCIKKRNDSAGVMATDLIRKWRKVVDREAEMENPPAVDEPEPYEPMPVDDVKFRKLAYEGVRNQQDQRWASIVDPSLAFMTLSHPWYWLLELRQFKQSGLSNSLKSVSSFY